MGTHILFGKSLRRLMTSVSLSLARLCMRFFGSLRPGGDPNLKEDFEGKILELFKMGRIYLGDDMIRLSDCSVPWRLRPTSFDPITFCKHLFQHQLCNSHPGPNLLYQHERIFISFPLNANIMATHHLSRYASMCFEWCGSWT